MQNIEMDEVYLAELAEHNVNLLVRGLTMPKEENKPCLRIENYSCSLPYWRGVVILVLAINLRPSPEVKPALERARVVDVINLEQQLLAPHAAALAGLPPRWNGRLSPKYRARWSTATLI